MDQPGTIRDQARVKYRPALVVAGVLSGGILGLLSLQTHKSLFWLLIREKILLAAAVLLITLLWVVLAFLKRLRRSEPITPKPSEPTEADALTRRVRLLRGTDDL